MDIVEIGLLRSVGVPVMPEKIKLQKYLKIRKGTENMWNPYILRTIPILHFVWVRYCLNMFITLSGCSNDAQKNQNPKIITN